MERVPTLVRQCGRAAVRDGEQFLGAVGGSTVQMVGRGHRGQLRVAQRDVRRERTEQLVRGGGLAVELKGEPVVGQQVARQCPVSDGLRVADRLDGPVVLDVPLGCPAMQGGQLVRLGPAQFEAQEVREEVVAAERGPRGVERHDEHARVLEVLQNPLAADVAGQYVGQWPVDAFEDRRAQQEPPDIRGLSAEHLGEQVLGDGPLTAGELDREALRIPVPGKQQGGKAQPGGPALRALVQQIEGRLRQMDPLRIEESPGLVEREAEVVGAEFGDPVLQAQPVQAEWQVVPRRQDETEPARGAIQEQRELAQCLLGAQLVNVVDDQIGRLLQRLQVLHQPLDDLESVQIGGRRHRSHEP